MVQKITALSRMLSPLLLLIGIPSIQSIGHGIARGNRIREFYIKEKKEKAKQLCEKLGVDAIDRLIYQQKLKESDSLVTGYVRQEYGALVTNDLLHVIDNYIMSGEVQICIAEGYQLMQEVEVMNRELNRQDCKVASGSATLLLFMIECIALWQTLKQGAPLWYLCTTGGFLCVSLSACIYTWCRRG